MLSEWPEDVFGEHEARVAVHASGGESGALLSPWRIDVAASVSGWSCALLVPSAACSGGQTGFVSVAETLAAWKRRAFSAAR